MDVLTYVYVCMCKCVLVIFVFICACMLYIGTYMYVCVLPMCMNVYISDLPYKVENFTAMRIIHSIGNKNVESGRKLYECVLNPRTLQK